MRKNLFLHPRKRRFFCRYTSIKKRSLNRVKKTSIHVRCLVGSRKCAACLYSGGDLLLLWLSATCLHLAFAMFHREQLLVTLVLWSSLSIAGAYWEWNAIIKRIKLQLKLIKLPTDYVNSIFCYNCHSKMEDKYEITFWERLNSG